MTKFLIPPSEGKSQKNSTDILFQTTDFIYKKQVDQILRTLKSLKLADIEKVYGTSPEKAKLIHKQNLNIKKESCSYAIERYTGTVFTHIDWQTFSHSEKEFFNHHFLVFSGLFGMVTPMTLIPNYKLKMNVLSLHKLWNPILSKALNKEDVIFDILPQIHKKAYTQNDNCTNIHFIVHKNGNKIHAGHHGKVIKGKFIRFLCKNQLTNFEDFVHFEIDGFKWDGKVFLKNSN